MLGLAGVFTGGMAAANFSASAQNLTVPPGLRFFDVKSYGATGTGQGLDSPAINRAIDACNSAGGGIVYVPPGVFLCGTVVLKSNVTLYLEAGATLLGSKNFSDYTPRPLRANEPPGGPDKSAFHADQRDTSANHLICARDAENVGLAGPGRVDGQGPSYWVPSGKEITPRDAWREAATHAWKASDRPSPMLEFYNVRHLRIEDVRIENSAGWTLRPVNCENVFIHGVSIKNPLGINTDGIDIVSSKNVLISDCVIDTGDDCICIKSENLYGDLKPTKNITVTNCILTSCCNGLKIGTATYGPIENITFSNSVIFNEDVLVQERVISGVAVEMVDGGSLEGVTISNIRMQRVRAPIFIRRGSRHLQTDGNPGTLRGVMIENVYATNSTVTSSITGVEGFDVEDVTLSGVMINTDEAGPVEWVNREIPEVAKQYPESFMFGRLPAHGLYCRHVRGLRLRNIEFKSAEKEARPAIICHDVKSLEITGLRSGRIAGDQPTVKLVQAQQAFIHGCVAPVGCTRFLELAGEQTSAISLVGNDLSGAGNPTKIGPEVPPKALKQSANV